MEAPKVASGDSQLVLARDLTSVGLGSQLRSASARGSLVRLRRGAYADAAAARECGGTERYRLAVRAVLSTRRDAVAAGLSAAVLHGLPMTGQWPREVRVLTSGASGRRRNDVIETPRRNGELVVEKDGFLVTSLLDTLVEVCRTAGFLTALTMVDAAARVDRYGHVRPLITLDTLAEIIEHRAPFRGSRRAQRVVEFATTDADTPFETLSRVAIWELGFPRPMLQYQLYLPRSRKTAFCDFG